MIISLTPSAVRLLRAVLAARAPELLPLVGRDGQLRLSDEQRLRISHSLAQELVARGLDANDEPNENGMEIEGLIDQVNRVRG
jgi:hypothetical protein